MAATPEQVADLRRMAAEQHDTTAYSDDALARIIERHPGDAVLAASAALTGAVYIDYDLNLAAADVWDEKAAAAARYFAFSDAGASYQRNQQYDQARQQAALYRSKRRPRSHTLRKEPLRYE